MDKHAYLIIAHNNFDILEKLIEMIDYEKNDIYVHVDKKVLDFNKEYFKNIPQKSHLFFTERINVNWGGLSQVKCELLLLEKAAEKEYSYYHLISGVDLPIKSQDYIHEFFKKNAGYEFIGFSQKWNDDRVKYFYPFNEIGKSKGFITLLKKTISYILVSIQKFLKVDRTRGQKFFKGANWFSISNNLVKYIILNKQEILDKYKHTILCDEVFLQTLVYNSDFRNRIYGGIEQEEYESNLRYIDWERGMPYIFRKKDFNQLIESNKLFARKFDMKIDKEIINLIYEKFKRKDQGDI